VVDANLTDVKPDFLYVANLRLWVEATIAVGAVDAADVFRKALLPHATLFTAARTAGFGVSVASILGRLAAMLGLIDESLSWHRRAIMATRRARAEHLVSEALAWLAADVARARGAVSSADASGAIDAAREAVEISTRTGAVAVRQIAESALLSLTPN
jgi:hypothetical protein